VKIDIFPHILPAKFIRQAVEAIEQMEISNAEKRKIFEDNARQLLRLPI
jgi:predicted TIM-barrel fold metal-dependent hydrolase